MNIGKLVNPLEFNRLPRVVHGFDRINESVVEVPSVIGVGQEQSLTLKSAVVLDVSSDESSMGENKLIIGNYAILYDKDGVPFEYNPRKSALHKGQNQFDRLVEWDNNNLASSNAPSGSSSGSTYSAYNYQQPVSCISELGPETIKNKLQSRGTIFIYKDVNEVKSKFNTIYGF